MDERIVTLGAGHGGGDAGARGLTGIAEKYLTLPLAQAAAAALSARGFSPHLLRMDDRFVSLADRGRTAAILGAFCHLEIHVEPTQGRRPEARVFASVDTPPDLPQAGALSAALARALNLRDAGGRVLPDPKDPERDRLTVLREGRLGGVPHLFQAELWMLGSAKDEARLQNPAVQRLFGETAATFIGALSAGENRADFSAPAADPGCGRCASAARAAEPSVPAASGETAANGEGRAAPAAAVPEAAGCGCMPEQTSRQIDVVLPGTWFIHAAPSFSSPVLGTVTGGLTLETAPARAGFRRVVFGGGIGYLSAGSLRPAEP